MNRRQSHLAVVLAFCVPSVVIGSVTGCRTPTTPPATVATPNAEVQTYADANKAIMTEFGETIKRLGQRPAPNFPPGATRRQEDEMWADSMGDLTNAATNALAKLDRLNPPPSLREIHDASRNRITVYRAGTVAFAAAVRRGDQAEKKAVRAKTRADDAAAYGKLRVAIRNQMIREGKTPEEAEAMMANGGL